MGIAQIALDPPPLSNGQTWKKVPQAILVSLFTPLPPHLTGNDHMEATYFKKGLPLETINLDPSKETLGRPAKTCY